MALDMAPSGAPETAGGVTSGMASASARMGIAIVMNDLSRPTWDTGNNVLAYVFQWGRDIGQGNGNGSGWGDTDPSGDGGAFMRFNLHTTGCGPDGSIDGNGRQRRE